VTLRHAVLAFACAAIAASAGCARGDAQPPPSCTPQVNATLAGLIARDEPQPADGVMVCGTTLSSSRPQRGGPHGGHELIPVRAPLPGGTYALVEVVTNDALDGVVTAPRGASVVALGQYFHTSARQRPYVAGIHETHCPTHRGGAAGYVIVNGVRYGCGA
jgi:hypothetical protein